VSAFRLFGIVLFAGLSACAGGPRASFRDRPGTGEARGFVYVDNSGLSVLTLATDVEQPLPRRLTVDAHGVFDRITVERKALDPADPGASGQATGHHHADMVTSASATATGGGSVSEARVEGALGLRYEAGAGGRPIRISGRVKASTEPDYGSLSAMARGEAELFDRNLTLAASFGAGHDTVTPEEPPPGQRGSWPASHDRFTAGFTVSQLLSPRIVASAGVAGTFQVGVLSSPYRRAVVRTSLFPEVVPGERARATAFASVSIAIRASLALHVRQGFCIDDWGVVAWSPEAALALEVARGALVTARYRMYGQTGAWFYKARYLDIEDIMTGDARLGPIREHAGGLNVQWTFLGRRGDFGALTAEVGYDLSWLEYKLLRTDVIVGHMPAVGVILSY
jgi:hypothetical protein